MPTEAASAVPVNAAYSAVCRDLMLHRSNFTALRRHFDRLPDLLIEQRDQSV